MSDFDSRGPLDDIDIQAGDVYALRTFQVLDGNLSSVVVGAGHWDNGICIAICEQTQDDEIPHTPPADGCHCGIYGTHSLRALFNQYGQYACRITTVIRVDGSTVTGATGLRTARAQVVAYWCGEDTGEAVTEADVCAAQLPGARRFYDIDVMARVYDLKRIG